MGSIVGDNRTICLPFDEKSYDQIVRDSVRFREHIDMMLGMHPQLFPSSISTGYEMKDIRYSKKLDIYIRRIKIDNKYYTIRPSFVMPYMVGMVTDVEKALLLRKYDVPYWVIVMLFGHNSMYWYRMERALGRNSLVGTVVQKEESLPKDLAADEKHTWVQGEKTYVATTVAEECILGVSIAEDAGEKALEESYRVFQEESRQVGPTYTPETVNTDGWLATKNAWKNLFPLITVIACFLHVFIKLRDGAKKKYKQLFEEVAPRLWDCYRAKTKAGFSQRVRRLHEWGEKIGLPDFMLERLKKFRDNKEEYARAYEHPGCHRTSNMLDRLMRKLDKHLFTTGYLHGSLDHGELSLRGWALLQNFCPSSPAIVKKHGGKLSRAERLNGFRYHNSWLQNLLISASLRGYRGPPPKA